MLNYALKGAFRKKWVTGLAVTGITLGIALMVGLNSISEGLRLKVDSDVRNAVGLVEIRDEDASQGYLSTMAPDCDQLVLTESPDRNRVIASSRWIIFPLSTIEQGDLGQTPAGNPRVLRFNGFKSAQILNLVTTAGGLASGRLPQDGAYECVVPNLIADEFPSRFKLGNSLCFKVNKGEAVDVKIVGVYVSSIDPHSVNMIPLFDIYMGIDAAQALYNRLQQPENREYHLLSPKAAPDCFSVLTLKYDSVSVAETERLITGVKTFLSTRYPGVHFQVYAKGKSVTSFSTLRDTISNFLAVVTVTALLAGSMSILISQMIGAEQRTREFAVLKATGWRNHDIVMEVLAESLIVSAIGGALGFAVGLIGVNAMAGMMTGMPTSVTANTILLTGAVTLILSAVGGLVPALKASRVMPATLLRGG